ncbi:unconventional myosin-XIX isoform X2 [Andrena cerasifolii]|uniref:unconventional myosin-XIX isoform X2 n=1 Tax=Andrena cerasifolii TaxID=2819439 RepID=UPI004037F078
MTTAIEPTSPFGWDLINDLSALPENEDTIIDFLLERLQRGQIYTWVGSLLLTLNPNNEVSTSHLYNSTEFDKYSNMSNDIYEADPHIFTVAAKAHYILTRELGQNCQVIIISGETGTGKTFNAFKCLEFLSTANKTSVLPCQGDYTHNIVPRITDTCRLISAFTTACTERNEVSSRHGQLVRLHYKGGAIFGATINSFLLERSRVTRGSNNFQIFYQMMFGMSDAELAAFKLTKCEDYDLLNTVDYNKRKYFQEGFQDTLKALEVLGFDVDQRKQIFQVLALLVHMGNIRFKEDGEACTIDLIDQKSREGLKNTCILSSLTEEAVTELLTTILINPGSNWRKHTSYHRYLVTVGACRNRVHSIIRHLYDLLFHWVLNRANDALSVKHEYSEWLGILDIFGFESFDKNGIEQLCVNYANEKMQQYFIETYLENSRKDLHMEGFIENSCPLNTINMYKERLSVLEETLFSILNDACQSPVMISVSAVIQLVCEKSCNAERKVLSIKEDNFIVEHYSGPVAYSIEDLLSKNTDKVPNEISMTFKASRNKFLRSLVDIDEEQHLHTVKTFTKKGTMLAKLKYNIDTLIKELSKCDLHYVRCVKPSRTNHSEWCRKEFGKQLACTGIFDALPLAKCRYPIRLRYKDFCKRYCKRPTEIIDRNKCEIILESVVPKRDLRSLVHYGKELIFLTESIFLKLESCRRNYYIKCANKIQIFWIRHRRSALPAISKYSTGNYKVRDTANKEITPVKLILDHELRKSSNSEGDDDVFITDSVSAENNGFTAHATCATENEKEIKDLHTKENVNDVRLEDKNNIATKKLGVLGKLQHDFEIVQRKCMNFKSQLRDLHVKKCFKNNVTKLMEKIDPEKFTKSKHCKNACKRKKTIDVNCTDKNNNSLRQCLWRAALKNSVTNAGLAENDGNQRYPVYYDKEKNLYTIEMNSHTLFCKNGILSRRRLAAVPIRLHTHPTCLINSHVIPRSEQPQGLQDCL